MISLVRHLLPILRKPARVVGTTCTERMCKCIYCKLHFDRCWLLQKYKFHHRVSRGLYNCHPQVPRASELHVADFSERIWEATKEQIRNKLFTRKFEELSAMRESCVAKGQIKALNRSKDIREEKDPYILYLYNCKLLRIWLIHSYWSTHIYIITVLVKVPVTISHSCLS